MIDAKCLRRLRKSVFPNQEAIAKLVGLKQSTYSEYERGLRDASLEEYRLVYEKIAHEIDKLSEKSVSLSDFYTPDPEPPPIDDAALDRALVDLIRLWVATPREARLRLVELVQQQSPLALWGSRTDRLHAAGTAPADSPPESES